ncbi:HAMP domain-containing protein [Leucothrix sargassi]|nr:HAMP domain-containing protein [Leucothrix sargassi]
MNIRLKITLFVSLFSVFIVAVLTLISVRDIRIQGAERVNTYKAEALEKVKNHLKDLVNVAFETVDNNYKKLSELEALKATTTGQLRYEKAKFDIEGQIKDSIKAMRYAEGTGYFWINDNTLPYPTMVMHPTLPELDGKVLDDPKFNNAQGVDKNLFTAFAEVTKTGSNEGFVEYLWPKPTATGLTDRLPKESYVRLHKPSGWIIGSGVYIDNIDAAVAVKKDEIDAQVTSLIYKSLMIGLAFILVSLVAAFMFSNSLAKPIQRLTEETRNISLGKDLDTDIYEVDRQDEIGQLARAVVRLRASVKIMMARMPRSPV